MKLQEIKEDISDSMNKLEDYLKQLNTEKERMCSEIEAKISGLQNLNIDQDELIRFLKDEEKFIIIPRKPGLWWVVVPKFVPLHVGWLEHETATFRIFAVNRYMNWIYDLPQQIKKRLQIHKPLPFVVKDGYLETGEDLQEVGWEKYKAHLTRREGKKKIAIRRGHEFKIIARIIEDGGLPFPKQPIAAEDLVDRDWDLKLRGYQERAWKIFMETGAIGVFWGFGAGKSIFGLYALGKLKGPKLVVVPTITLREQWEKRISDNFNKKDRQEIEVITYTSYHKVKKNTYTLTVFDEVHHLPANTYISLSMLDTKYRIGLSGSPFREDGREDYIIALTGFPVGLNWEELIKIGAVNIPKFRLYIVNSYPDKFKKLKTLLQIPVKTLVFCDSIKLGKQISSRFDIPFVHGGTTKNRMEILEENDVVVVSRVGDEGVSLPTIERVIEVAFLFGSRMQESQRFGRLMHSQKKEPEHIIIMTNQEFMQYQKRLYAIYERGFKLEVVRS